MANEIDDALFKSMPRSVRELALQARKEKRQKKRQVWAQQHPERIPKR